MTVNESSGHDAPRTVNFDDIEWKAEWNDEFRRFLGSLRQSFNPDETFDWDSALTPGMIPWGFQDDTLTRAARSARSYALPDALAIKLLTGVAACFENKPGREPWEPARAAEKKWRDVCRKHPPGRDPQYKPATMSQREWDSYLELAEKLSKEDPPGEQPTDDVFIDVADLPRSANDYLVKGLFYLPGVGMLHAVPGLGKTFVALDLTFHLALGMERWCGYRLPRRRVRTLYLYSEGVPRLWKRRDAWLKFHNRKVDDLRGYVSFYPGAIPLNASDDIIDGLIKRIQIAKYELVVIDTWAKANIGSNENEVAAMSLGLSRLRRVSEETGACILVVHHDTKDGKDYRGSGSIDGELDSRLHLRRSGSHADRKFVIDVPKMRDDMSGQNWNGYLETVHLGTDEDGDPITSVVFVQQIIEHVPAVFDIKAVIKAVWDFIVSTSEDDAPPPKTKIVKGSFDGMELPGTQKQRTDAVEWLVKEKLVEVERRQGTRSNGAVYHYEAVLPRIGSRFVEGMGPEDQ